jgi:Uma2 family endonuclease
MDSMSATALLTVEEFLRLPEPKSGHYELHHGEVVLVPPPKWGHTRIQARIETVFRRLLGDNGIVAAEMPFQPSPEYEVWVADVGFVLAERAGVVKENEYLQGAPDLVVEVLSPSNTVAEINDKMAVCLENGCSSFWVVDGKRKEVQVTEGDVTRRYKGSSTVTSAILGGSIQVEELF